MGGLYDEMSDRSYPDYPAGTALQRWHRDLLRRAMAAEGFTVYEAEWWHFDYKDWKQYRIENRRFEDLDRARCVAACEEERREPEACCAMEFSQAHEAGIPNRARYESWASTRRGRASS